MNSFEQDCIEGYRLCKMNALLFILLCTYIWRMDSSNKSSVIGFDSFVKKTFLLKI